MLKLFYILLLDCYYSRARCEETKAVEAQMLAFLEYAGTENGFIEIATPFDMAKSTAHRSVSLRVHSSLYGSIDPFTHAYVSHSLSIYPSIDLLYL